MKQTLNFSALDPETLDKKNGIVYGVALCTAGPARGHGLTVDRKTLEQLYESAESKGKIPTKLDHRTGIKEVCGFLTDFWIDSGRKLRANWHLLKSQPSFAHTWETIEKLSDVCGLSCSFTGDSEDDRARCRELISCDFVPHPATGNGLFSRGDLDFDALDENSDNPQTENEEDDMEDMNDDNIGEILHHLMDRVEQLEDENAQLREALGLQGEDDGEDNATDPNDSEPVLEETGARGGPHQYGALNLQTFDFESAIEENRRAGMDGKKAHIEALKQFARSKYQTLNL